MKRTGFEFVMNERDKRGESDVRTAKLLGISQPGLFKARQSGISFRMDNFVKYCNATGYEVVVVPKQYVTMFSDEVTLICENQEEDVTE